MPKIRGIKPDIWTDEDFIDLSPLARLLFIGLWNFSCDNGHVQDKSKQIKMRILPGDDANCAQLLAELADSGMVTRSDGWITIPNFRKHQRLDKRWFQKCDAPGCSPQTDNPQPETRGGHDEATTRTQRGHSVDSSGPRRHGDVDVDGELRGIKTPPSEIADAIPDRDDIDRICIHLADRIAANGSKRPTITKTWRDAARLMIDRDGRTEEQVHACIDWCQNDDFWKSNIMSMPKLREKYDQLRLRASTEAQPVQTFQQRAYDDLFDAAMSRAVEADRRQEAITP